MKYKDTKLLTILSQCDITIIKSCIDTSQKNGHIECKHKHILDTIHNPLIYAAHLEMFCAEIALTIVYIVNCIPIIVIGNQSPYECLYGKIHNYNLL